MKITRVLKWLGAQDKSKKGSAELKLVRPSSIALGALVKEIGWQVLALATNQSPRKLMPRLKMIFKFSLHVHRFARFHGDLAAAKYLKAALLAVQRCMAGQPVKTLRELEPDLPLCRLATCGLPRIIGTHDRRLILRGNQDTITLWMSLLSLYRVFDADSKAKVETITQPFGGDSEFTKGFEAFVPKGIRVFKGFIKTTELPRKGIQLVSKASPTAFKVSFLSLEASLLALHHKGLLDTLKLYIWETNNGYLWSQLQYLLKVWEIKWAAPVSRKVIYLRFRDVGTQLPEILGLDPKNKYPKPKDGTYVYPLYSVNLNHEYGIATLKWDPKNLYQILFITEATTRTELGCLSTTLSPLEQTANLWVGRLSPKVEAAGKLRIFAMVDIWTQSALYPLHVWLFDILRRIPNDGTFDQEASVERGWDKAKKYGCSYGYDLSAATDRLPLSLQVVILSQFFGAKVAEAWAKLLVERDYAVSDNVQRLYNLRATYRYAVGQPMGAYSSWAMLAITHHYIVQMSALHAGHDVFKTWFDRYELLGDDIDIFDGPTAAVYLQIMKGLGVEINMKKSVVDTKGRVTEFAKRTAIDGKDVSGISWAALKQLKDGPSRLTYALSVAVRGKRSLVGRVSAMMSKNLGMLRHVTPRSQERMLSLLMSRVLTSGPGAWRSWIPYLISKEGDGWVANKVLRFPLALSQRVLTASAFRRELELTPPSFQTYVYRLYERSIEWAVRARVIVLIPRVKNLLLNLEAKWAILQSEGFYDPLSVGNFNQLTPVEIQVLVSGVLWKHINAFRKAAGMPAVEQTWMPYWYGIDAVQHPVRGDRACIRAAIEESFFDVTVVQTLPIKTCYDMLECLENLLTVNGYPSQVRDKLHGKTKKINVDQSSLAVKILATLRQLRATSPYGMGPIGYKVWPRWEGKGVKRGTSKVA